MGKLLGLSMKLKVIFSAIGVGVVAAATAIIISVINKEELFRVLKLFDLTGTAVVDRTDTGRLGAYVGMNLQGGDTFSVEKESNAVISLDSDKYMFLDSETVIDLIARGSENDSLTSITLISGSILNEITTPLSANSSYEIYTPKASMAVRGTEFHVKSQMIGSICAVDLDVLHGRVEVNIYDENGNVKHGPVYVEENKKVSLITEPGKTGSINANDAETYFVFRDGDEFTAVTNGEDPVRESDFSVMSAEAKKFAIKNNNDGSLVLDSLVMKKLIGTYEEASVTAASEETDTAGTTASYVLPSSVPQTVSENSDEETTYSISDETSVYSESSSTETSRETETAEETAVPDITQIISESETVTASPSDTEPPITTVDTAETTVSDTTTEAETSAEKTDETTAKETTSEKPVLPAATSGTDLPPEETTPGSEPEPEPNEKCSVSFYVNGELYKTITVEKGKTLTALPTYNGKTVSWYADGKILTADTIINGDITAVYNETEEKYTVKFVADGVTVAEYKVDKGGKIPEIPAVPKKTGYSGIWKLDGEMFDSSAPVNSDMTITAVYSAKELTVKFVPGLYVSSSEYLGIVTVKYGECVALADFPVIDWIPEPTIWQCGGILFDQTTPVYEDMIVSLYPAKSIEYELYTFSASHPEYGCVKYDLGADHYMDQYRSILSLLSAKTGAPTTSEKYYFIDGMSFVPITSNDNTPSSLGVSSASLLTFYKGPLAVLNYGTGNVKVPANAKIANFLPALLEGKAWYCGDAKIDSSVTPASLGWNGKDVLYFNAEVAVEIKLNIYYPTSDEGNIADQKSYYTKRNSYTIYSGETLPVSLASLISTAQSECDKYAELGSPYNIGFRAEGFCIMKDGEVVQELSASTIFTKDMAYSIATGYNIDLYADIAQHIYGVNFMRFRGSYIEMPGTIPYYVAYNAKLRSTLDGMISDTAYTWHFVNGSSYKELSSTDTIESLGLMDETSDLMFYYGIVTELNYPGGKVQILPDANILDSLPASDSGWKIILGADEIIINSTHTPITLSSISSGFINSITVTPVT